MESVISLLILAAVGYFLHRRGVSTAIRKASRKAFGAGLAHSRRRRSKR